MSRTVLRVLTAAGVALLLSVGCSGEGPASTSTVGADVTIPPVTPSASVVGPAEADRQPAAFVTYSAGSNRLSYLTKDLKVLRRQTQLRSPLHDLAGLGHDVAVGFDDGQVSLIKASTGATIRIGRVDTAALGRAAHGQVAHGPNTFILDELFAGPSSLMVGGRFGLVGAHEFSGFVQELDVHTLAAIRTFTFSEIPQDLHTDASGHVLCLIGDGSIVDLSEKARVRWRRPEKPRYFLPLPGSRVATLTDANSTSTLWLADGHRVPLGAGSGPFGFVDLGKAGYAVILRGEGVLRIDQAGVLTHLPITDDPYEGVFDGSRLLIAQADSNKLVAIDPSPFTVSQTVTLDWGVADIVKVD
jgi:hypothetical protein